MAEMKNFKVVPVEVTGEMEDAARDWSYDKYGKPIGNDASHGVYQALLTAAPTEPTEAVEALVEAVKKLLALHIAHHNDPVHVETRAALDRARKAGIVK